MKYHIDIEYITVKYVITWLIITGNFYNQQLGRVNKPKFPRSALLERFLVRFLTFLAAPMLCESGTPQSQLVFQIITFIITLSFFDEVNFQNTQQEYIFN